MGQDGNTIFRDEALKAIPTNWVDSLLTGPNKALPDGFSYTPKDIERLLLAVRARIEALPLPPGTEHPHTINTELLEAAKEALAAAVEDFGDPDDDPEDEGAVGGGLKEDGSPDPMAITFRHMRRLRTAISNAEKAS